MKMGLCFFFKKKKMLKRKRESQESQDIHDQHDDDIKNRKMWVDGICTMAQAFSLPHHVTAIALKMCFHFLDKQEEEEKEGKKANKKLLMSATLMLASQAHCTVPAQPGDCRAFWAGTSCNFEGKLKRYVMHTVLPVVAPLLCVEGPFDITIHDEKKWIAFTQEIVKKTKDTQQARMWTWWASVPKTFDAWSIESNPNTKCVGEGTAASVFTTDQKQHVLKQFVPHTKDACMSRPVLNNFFVRELGCLIVLFDTPHVAHLVKVGFSHESPHLVLEHRGVSLHTMRLTHNHIFSLQECKQLLHDWTTAIQHAQTQHDIYHRDLSTHNLLIDSKMRGYLCDWSHARYFKPHVLEPMTNGNFAGTLLYYPPEVLYQKRFHSDWSSINAWTLGLNLLFMVSSYTAHNYVFSWKIPCLRMYAYLMGLPTRENAGSLWPLLKTDAEYAPLMEKYEKGHASLRKPALQQELVLDPSLAWCKTLLLDIFQYDPAKRPTLDKILFMTKNE